MSLRIRSSNAEAILALLSRSGQNVRAEFEETIANVPPFRLPQALAALLVVDLLDQLKRTAKGGETLGEGGSSGIKPQRGNASVTSGSHALPHHLLGTNHGRL
jgi:hypothetical protein